MSWIGGILQGFGSVIQGQKQKEQAYYNAEVAYQSAQATRTGAALTEHQTRKEIKDIISQQRAGYAFAGVNVTTGSPLDVLFESLANAELDVAIGNYNAEVEARQYESGAQISKWEGRQAFYGGIAQGGLTLLQTGVSASNSSSPTVAKVGGRRVTSANIAPSDYYKTKIGH